MKVFEPHYDSHGIPHYGKDNPYDGKEYKMQEATGLIVQYVKSVTAIHVPNERSAKTNKFTLFSLARQGVRAGVSDWIFFTPSTAFIELKAKGGKLNDNQIAFLLEMKDKGFPIAVCWNLDAFEYLIKLHANKNLK